MTAPRNRDQEEEEDAGDRARNVPTLQSALHHLVLRPRSQWRRRRLVARARRQREEAALWAVHGMATHEPAAGSVRRREQQQQQQQQQQARRVGRLRKRGDARMIGTGLVLGSLLPPLLLDEEARQRRRQRLRAALAKAAGQKPPTPFYRPRLGPADDVATDPFAIEMLRLAGPSSSSSSSFSSSALSAFDPLPPSPSRRRRAGRSGPAGEPPGRLSLTWEPRPSLTRGLRRERRRRQREREQRVEREAADGRRHAPATGAGRLDADDEEEEGQEGFWTYRSQGLDVGKLLGEEATTAATGPEMLAAFEALLADQKLFLAGKVADKIEDFLLRTQQGRDSAGGDDGEAAAAVAAVRRAYQSERMQAQVRLLRRRLDECRQAVKDLDSDDGWIFAQHVFGVTTLYQMNPDGSIRIKLDGKLEETRAHDMFAVLKEADGYRHMVPFCDRSEIVHEFNKTEMVLHFSVNIPFLLQRDALLHVYTCDNADELPAPPAALAAADEETKDERRTSHGQRPSYGANASSSSIIFVGESIEAAEAGEETEGSGLPPSSSLVDFGGLDLPAVVGKRMQLKGLRAQITILSTTAVTIKVITTIDPKAPLPQSVLNFCTKRVAGMLIYFVKQQAARMTRDPANDPLAVHIRRRAHFYRQFLLPRIQEYCDRKGWETVPMAALEAASPAGRETLPSLGRRRADLARARRRGWQQRSSSSSRRRQQDEGQEEEEEEWEVISSSSSSASSLVRDSLSSLSESGRGSFRRHSQDLDHGEGDDGSTGSASHSSERTVAVRVGSALARLGRRLGRAAAASRPLRQSMGFSLRESVRQILRSTLLQDPVLRAGCGYLILLSLLAPVALGPRLGWAAVGSAAAMLLAQWAWLDWSLRG